MGRGKSMRELSESDKLKTFFDPRLIKAMGHPVREHILAVMNERIASAREIGEELGVDVSSFYHHIEELERLEFIECVKTRRRRGATERFFRAKRTLFFSDRAWEELPDSLKADVANNALQLLFDDVVKAVKAGTLEARSDRHVSWNPATLDAEGWAAVTELLENTLTSLKAIQRAASTRIAQGAAPQINATMAILAYETPLSMAETNPGD